MCRSPSSCLRTGALLAGLALGAVALSASVFAATEKAPAALVLGLHSLPEGMTLLRWDGPVAVVAGDGPGYVARLYRAGAWIVLPFRKSGCMPAPDAGQRRASLAILKASAVSTAPISQR